MRASPIGAYERLPAICLDYDPNFPAVADLLAELIASELPDVTVEHIGSTSVPGCAGKGIIDLQVLYPAGRLESVRDTLDALGFQRQQGRDPWPEDRPMRIGSIGYDGKTYRVHAHVVAAKSPEMAVNRRFRDRLRAEPDLLAAYVARKRTLLAAGLTDTYDYSVAKSAFVEAALARDKA